jgi:hypothetical protein
VAPIYGHNDVYELWEFIDVLGLIFCHDHILSDRLNITACLIVGIEEPVTIGSGPSWVQQYVYTETNGICTTFCWYLQITLEI